MNGAVWLLGLVALFALVRFSFSSPTIEWTEHDELDALERMWEES